MRDDGSGWTAEDVPDGPYFHGSRAELLPGEALVVSAAADLPGSERGRRRCWATTSWEAALQYARSRNQPTSGTLYIYEVDLDGAEVDTDIYRSPCRPGEVASVMAPSGRVVRLVHRQPA